MPRKLPPFVERNHVKGKTYLSFRKGKGARIRLPDDPTSEEFHKAYQAILAGEVAPRLRFTLAQPGTIAALVAAYKASGDYGRLRSTTKASYSTPLEYLREQHGHRSVRGMTRTGIEEAILKPFDEKPGQKLSVLKILRVLIRHAMAMRPPLLAQDPSFGIKRPKTREIRAWTDAEHAAFERRWPLGTKQRTAYELMLNVGTARVDAHKLTWRQLEEGARYSRSKTGVGVDIGQSERLQAALAAWPQQHITVINTEFGKPFTVAGFGNFMRAAIDAAGLPKDCKPHGLRKSLGRRLADAGVPAHGIMAVLGHRTLEEAERYTREANMRRAGKNAIATLDRGQKSNTNAQTATDGLGEPAKKKGKST